MHLRSSQLSESVCHSGKYQWPSVSQPSSPMSRQRNGKFKALNRQRKRTPQLLPSHSELETCLCWGMWTADKPAEEKTF